MLVADVKEREKFDHAQIKILRGKRLLVKAEKRMRRATSEIHSLRM